MKRSLSAATAACLVVASLGVAHAQDVVVQGPGVKVGESTVLRPKVGVELGAISNLFYEEDSTVSTAVMRLLTSLELTPFGDDRVGDMTGGARSIDFQAGLDLQYSEYLSSNARARSQRNLDVGAFGGVTFNPQGAVAFALRDKFTRVTRPTNFESTSDLDRDINHFEAEATYQPGGRMLRFAARYENTIDVFESNDFADRLQHVFGLRGTWKFFPYSQTWLDTSLGFYGPLGSGDIGGMPYKQSSRPLRIVAGIDTLLTELVTVKAYLGYANGFYEAGPSFNTVVGGLETGWRYLPFGRVVGSYAYDVSDSINANYYQEHRLRLSVNQQVRTIFMTGMLGGRLRSYQGVPAGLGASDVTRSDFILEAEVRGSYIIQDRYSVYADYLLQSDQTEFRTTIDGQTDDPSYVRHELVIGASAAF